jgi:hypothetical protein
LAKELMALNFSKINSTEDFEDLFSTSSLAVTEFQNDTRDGGSSIKITSGYYSIPVDLPYNSDSSLFVSFLFKCDDATDGGQTIFRILDGGSTRFTCQITPYLNRLYIDQYNDLYASLHLMENTWHRMKLLIQNKYSGVLKIWFDDNLIYETTSNRTSSNDVFSSVRFYSNEFKFGDVAVLYSDALMNDDEMTYDFDIIDVSLDNDVSNTMDVSGGATAHEVLSSDDESTSFVSGDQSGEKTHVSLTDQAYDNCSGVVTIISNKSGTSPFIFKRSLTIAGTTSNAKEIYPESVWKKVIYGDANSPNGSWTISDLNNLEIELEME